MLVLKNFIIALVLFAQVFFAAGNQEVYLIDKADTTYHDEQGITIVDQKDNSRYRISDKYKDYDHMINLTSDKWKYDDDFIAIFYSEDLSDIKIIIQVDSLN